MIHTLKGIITQCVGHCLVVEVGGVGLGVTVPFPGRFQKGETVELAIAFQWNEESGPHLYGFTSATERELFTLIVSCSGIGPKLALVLLQQSTTDQIVSALIRSDHSYLSSLKGLGPKKAEVLVMHLRTKVEHLVQNFSSSTATHAPLLRDVSQALQALRYSPAEVAQALDHIERQDLKPDVSFDQIMRMALGYFTRPK